MYKICAILGTPSQSEWPEGFKLAAKMNFQFPKFTSTSLASLIPGASADAIDLL